MRANYSRWSWVGVTSCCLALTALSGCKSSYNAPGASWLSWGKPKPTANSLASVPKKPSVGALPTPSATTAGAAAPYGQSGYGQLGYAGNATTPSGYGANSNGSGATGYQTGPYNTGAAGGYPGTTSGLTGSPAAGAAGPYRSPYQAAQGGASEYNSGSGYTVADSRSDAGYQAAGGSGTQPWNSDAYRRAGDPYGNSQASASPYGGAQAAGSGSQTSDSGTAYPQTQSPYANGNYGAANAGGYQQPASYQQAPQGSAATATHAYTSDAGPSSYSTNSPSAYDSSSTGGYRPGSTSRETGALSNLSTAGAASAGSYPTTGTAAPATANQPWSYGASGQYPTTGQY